MHTTPKITTHIGSLNNILRVYLKGKWHGENNATGNRIAKFLNSEKFSSSIGHEIRFSRRVWVKPIPKKHIYTQGHNCHTFY